MTILESSRRPSFVKQSRAKIWIRTGLLSIFGALFTFSFTRASAPDISTGPGR